MEKRYLLAFVLSFLVLMGYSAILPKKQPVDNKKVTLNQTEGQNVPAPMLPPDESLPSASEKPQEKYNLLCDINLKKIECEGFELTFSKMGGFILEVYHKANKAIIPIHNIGLVKEWAEYPFEVSELPKGVVFSYRDNDGVEINKTFRVKPGNRLELSVTISNATNSKITGYNIVAGYVKPTAARDVISSRYFEVSGLANNILFRKSVYGLKNSLEHSGKISWIGLRDRYFCAVFLPQVVSSKSVIEKSEDGYNALLRIEERPTGSGPQTIEDQYHVYIGSQNVKELRKFSPGTEEIVNYGTFDSIAKALLFLLEKTHGLVKNWGLSIILVTILVYLILFPLSWKSMLSMKKMQAVQPKVEEIRIKFKDNPQKLNQEIMELYRREKVNPFGGCLPMLLQIPVFFALYQVLMRFISLRGATFLWIKDLSEPDRFFVFKPVFPVIGNEFNLLPILMAGGMFIQQKLTSMQVGKDSAAAEQQKIMAIVMPLMFGVLFYKMSSGLVLYWFVNNLLTIAFQWKISKK